MGVFSIVNILAVGMSTFQKFCFVVLLIYSTDLNNLESLTKEKFNSALCRLIPKVTNPGNTLYQMICAIQKILC